MRLKPFSPSKLTLICPTIGRASLRDLVEHVVPMMGPLDEFIIVGDGPVEYARALAAGWPQVTYFELPSRVGDFGCTPCDEAIARARGDYVFFTGDDDLPTDDVFNLVRSYIDSGPRGIPHIFAMTHTGRVLSRSIKVGTVSGQQLVVPRNLQKLPKMADVKKEDLLISDWVFINKVYLAWSGMVIFHDALINTLPKQRYGL